MRYRTQPIISEADLRVNRRLGERPGVPIWRADPPERLDIRARGSVAV
jgi:hypothetical protein